MAIAVDLDGTLAHYDGWIGEEHIGDPIQPIVDMVKRYIAAGEEVIIFTARATSPEAIMYVEQWLKDNGLPKLKVTNIKLKSFQKIYDDRAVRVVTNKGEIL